MEIIRKIHEFLMIIGIAALYTWFISSVVFYGIQFLIYNTKTCIIEMYTMVNKYFIKEWLNKNKREKELEIIRIVGRLSYCQMVLLAFLGLITKDFSLLLLFYINVIYFMLYAKIMGVKI